MKERQTKNAKRLRERAHGLQKHDAKADECQKCFHQLGRDEDILDWIQCDNCVHYCPDLAVRREGDGYLVLTDYCKGCGLCVKECPTGSMKMVEEAR